MRSSAQVLPDCFTSGRINVVVDGELGAPDLDTLVVVARTATLQTNELELVGLIGELSAGFILRDNTTYEALTRANNALHQFLNSFKVFGCEGFGHVEVVIETISDGRSDA
ncbi:unannotated protein [freshwater metagenome]|uniref:Unannotated protein n=1 Tax=freshwater metagenome TaxID=449393 RepID=A0A6J6EDS7_9ZZZZ